MIEVPFAGYRLALLRLLRSRRLSAASRRATACFARVQHEAGFLMPSKTFLILRRPRSGRLEGRRALMQSNSDQPARRAAISAASFNAAIRLSGRAMPLPAMLKAVL